MAVISQVAHFDAILLNENMGISIQISLKFVPKGPIDSNHHWFR